MVSSELMTLGSHFWQPGDLFYIGNFDAEVHMVSGRE